MGECFGGRPADRPHTCPQCDASHTHDWVAWHDAPKSPSDPGSSVTGGQSGPGIPVRCRVCGGRKCDRPSCLLRRHHPSGHENY